LCNFETKLDRVVLVRVIGARSFFALSGWAIVGNLSGDMGDEASLLTGQTVTDHGIYQSACGCRTALTLFVDQVLPRCMGCDEAVEWRLVQEIRSSKPPSARAHPSGTRFIAAKVSTARPRLDSASGED
jgi:hypothetical protein